MCSCCWCCDGVWSSLSFHMCDMKLGFSWQEVFWVFLLSSDLCGWRLFIFLNYHSPFSLSFHHSSILCLSLFVPPPLFYFRERERERGALGLWLFCAAEWNTGSALYPAWTLFSPPFSFSSLIDDPFSMLLPLWSSSITSPSFSNSDSFT